VAKRFPREDAERQAQHQIQKHLGVQKKPPRCTCTNHIGGPKQQFKTRDAALTAIIRTHAWTGKGYSVYPCPTSDRFHVRSHR
jgi:hypothetical protein